MRSDLTAHRSGKAEAGGRARAKYRADAKREDPPNRPHEQLDTGLIWQVPLAEAKRGIGQWSGPGTPAS